MAPSRRKGANKASAAVARRKWKVGDLVLAKVKGFPAWPATVSEPEKWGYPADSRKVLVYFFGTQQIAFCNPVDVEEFTEEKKVSLLGKRHGKGSDFVRALNEIIGCFEKLNEQDQVASDILTQETNITTENNSDETLTRSVNDEAAIVTAKRFCSGATDDLKSLTEAAVAAAAEDEMQSEEVHSKSGFRELHVYSTRSKTDAVQSRNIGPQRRISARRLRSSSRVDAGGLQSLVLPSTNNHKISKRLATNVPYKSVRRSRRIMKSPDDSEGYRVNPPPFASNNNLEENDSGIMTVDSDSDSLNDNSSVDTDCKTVGEEPFVENNEGEAELSDRLDFHGNATIVKKKRKPNRKRHRCDLMTKLDEVVSETEILKIECASPSNNEKVAESCRKEDGDEHLPLLKRARVRMGRSSPAVDKEGNLAYDEKNSLEVPESSTDRESDHTVGIPDASSKLHASPAREPQYWETRKNFVDGEAALPPSKRLHRALEAMSANAAEHSQRPFSCSPTLDTHTEGCSSSAKCSDLSIPVIEMRSGQVEDHICGVSEICPRLNMEVLENDGKTTEVVIDFGKTSSSVDRSCPELCKKSFERVGGVESKCLKLAHLNECTDAEHQNVNPDSLNNGEGLSHLDSSRPCLVMSPSGCKVKPLELKEAANRSDADISPMNPDSIFVEEIAGGSFNIEKCIHIGSADEGGHKPRNTKHLSLSENNQNSQRADTLGDARPGCAGSIAAPSASPVKVLNSGDHELLFCSNTVSTGHLEDWVVSVPQSSSYVIDGPESAARASPLSSSVCNISSSDSSVEKNSSCSNAQSLLEKAKLVGKSSSKVELLPSFEAIIRSLTRAKDSIGRATRIAIDCAKSGHANKVVELLAHNLESESSPQKKVDLFFLVDSIAQCSGGMKGDAGIYPSLIQALLPRLLLAAAPPGTTFYENHKLCLKVLRVWLERKILPETLIRRHIRELDTHYGLHITGVSRRACRFERPFDDPIRAMEGMLVDEYGSNSSIQLPGFCMPPMRRDDDIGSDSDGENFEAVTPEHNIESLHGETTVIAKAEKRSHILEDVDGELEMEDVAPTCDVEITSTSNTTGTDCKQMLLPLSDKHCGAPFDPQQPMDTQLISVCLPRSPPPPPPSAPPPQPPPPPPSVFPHAGLDSVSKVTQSKLLQCSQERNEKRSLSPRVKPRTLDAVHRRRYDNTDSEAQLPRQMSYCSNTCPFGEEPTPHLSARASSGFYPVDGAFGKDFHLHPPQPAPSNQFSFVSEQRIQSRRDIPHHPHPNRFHARSAENGNYYRDRDRNRFGQRDNIGEHWRPPLPSISGPYYHDDSRMAHAPMSYNGPPREPAFPNNRWNFPSRSMNHRQFHPYRPPSEGPIPVTNRGHNFWKAR